MVGEFTGLVPEKKLRWPAVAGAARRLAIVWAIFGLSCGVPGVILLTSPEVFFWAKIFIGGTGAAYWIVGSWVYLKYAE